MTVKDYDDMPELETKQFLSFETKAIDAEKRQITALASTAIVDRLLMYQGGLWIIGITSKSSDRKTIRIADQIDAKTRKSGDMGGRIPKLDLFLISLHKF